jgi:hypothetical protein
LHILDPTNPISTAFGVDDPEEKWIYIENREILQNTGLLNRVYNITSIYVSGEKTSSTGTILGLFAKRSKTTLYYKIQVEYNGYLYTYDRYPDSRVTFVNTGDSDDFALKIKFSNHYLNDSVAFKKKDYDWESFASEFIRNWNPGNRMAYSNVTIYLSERYFTQLMEKDYAIAR